MPYLNSIVADGSTGHHTFQLDIFEDSTSIADNTSTIAWNFLLMPKHLNYDWSGWGSTVKYSVTVNGETTTGTIPSYDGKSTVYLASKGNISVTHNADGKKSIAVSFSVNSSGNTTYYLPGTASASDTFNLSDIPRAATITSAPSSFNDTDNPTIYYSNPAGTSVEELGAYIYWDGATESIYRTLNKTSSSQTFTLTDAERKRLRQAVTSSNGELNVQFYIWTKIGGVDYRSFVPSVLKLVDFLPTLNPTVVDTLSASIALTGNAATMIRGFNKMRATANAQARKEATITDRKIINSGETRYGSEEDFTNTSSNTFEFRISDSRNSTAQQTITVPMVNYIQLTCNVDGSIKLDTEDSTKAVISFTASGNYFSGSFGKVSNTLNLWYSVEYEGGGISLTPLTIPSNAIKSDGTYSLEYTIPNKYDYQKSYTIKIVAEDKIKYIESSSKTLKAVPVFDWGETDFNFNVPVSINNVEIDYPVEQGTKNGWYYRKWNSGFAECWYSANVSGIDMGEFNMNGFYYCGSKGVNFPFTFTQVYYIGATGGSTGNMNIIRPFSNNNTYMTYVLMGHEDLSSASARVNLEVKGMWK